MISDEDTLYDQQAELSLLSFDREAAVVLYDRV